MTTNFVFSSVGDNTSFDDLYIGNNMNYDLYVIYYGDDNTIYDKYKSKVTFIEKRKGSKFQNFKYFYEKYPEIINKYDYFFILDDDIIIDVPRINEMFSIAKHYNLSICGPSFEVVSKISHAITKRRQNILLAYTNFVEVNVPLFNKKALTNLMKILDYSLIGWGIDMLYIWCNGLYEQNTYAIIHKIGCINPHEKNKKNKKRELDILKNCNIREQLWKTYARKINCPARFNLKIYNLKKIAHDYT
jgi:hypothetical protein